MEVRLLAYTPEPENMVAAAARLVARRQKIREEIAKRLFY